MHAHAPTRYSPQCLLQTWLPLFRALMSQLRLYPPFLHNMRSLAWVPVETSCLLSLKKTEVLRRVLFKKSMAGWSLKRRTRYKLANITWRYWLLWQAIQLLHHQLRLKLKCWIFLYRLTGRATMSKNGTKTRKLSCRSAVSCQTLATRLIIQLKI